jgi:hypothetical protein
MDDFELFKRFVDRSFPSVIGLSVIMHSTIQNKHLELLTDMLRGFNARNQLKHLSLYLPNSGIDQ